MSRETLIHAWRALPVESAPPFGFASDLKLIGSTKHSVTYSYEQWLNDGGAERERDPRFHLGLLPVPYLGDITRASIFLLMLNPGFSPGDYFAEYSVSDCRAALIRSLRQEFLPDEHPFFFLDPKFSWHPGGVSGTPEVSIGAPVSIGWLTSSRQL